MEICFSISDAGAVNISGNFVLAGIGRSVCVFSIQRNKLLSKRETLSLYKVRGLSLNSDDNILVYGGKEVGILKFTENDDEVETTSICLWKSDDWIVHSKWLEYNEIATLSAHNVVAIWNNRGVQAFQIKCQEQSILYSGYLFGDKCNDLICFAGTVFGQVAIWSVNTKNCDVSREAMHFLRGHKGAVFSIRYDPVSNLICTTSDDRSVRWWYKSSPIAEKNMSSGSLHESWSAAHVFPVSIGYGHLSRVWKCFISPSFTFSVGEDSQLCVWRNLEIKHGLKSDECEQKEFPLIARKQILRGGSIWDVDFSLNCGLLALGLEDGGVLVWTLNSLVSPAHMSSHSPLGKSDPPRRVCLYGKELKPMVITKSGTVLIKKRSGDDLSNWQNACDKTYIGLSLLKSNLGKKSVALTSSDGSLDIYSGSHPGADDSTPCNDGNLKHVASVTFDGDYVLSVHWLADDLILTCRSQGQLQLWYMFTPSDGSIILREVTTWVLPHSKQRWTTAAAWVPWGEPPGLILCGNRSGDLLVYSKDSRDPIQTLKNVHGQMGITSLLVFWPTYSGDRNWMPTYGEMYEFIREDRKVQVLSDLVFNVEIYSTGRDGIVNVFLIKKGILKIKRTEKLGFEWAAQCLVINKNILVFGFKGACAVIWGIKERCILLEKNCGGGHRSWDIDHISQSDGSHSLLLAMVKSGELITVDWKLPPGILGGSVVQVGLHSKEINCVHCFNLGKYFSALRDTGIVVTGSEDTTAKVSKFSYNRNENEKNALFSTISILQGHLSSIRALSILPLFSSPEIDQNHTALIGFPPTDFIKIGIIDYLLDFMVFSAGGRAQMKAWKLSFYQSENVANMGMGPYKEQCIVEEKFSLMLDYKRKESKNIENDLETRFMDVCSFYPKGSGPGKPLDMILVAVVAACSDGLLRIFGYRENQSNPKMAERKPYLGLWSLGIPHPEISIRHCLFKVLHSLIIGHEIVITTDCVGYYHLWDVTSEVESLQMNYLHFDNKCADPRHKEPLSPFFSKLSHQFSINAVDWKLISKQAVKDLCTEDQTSQNLHLMLIATGGEDGALVLDLLELHESGKNGNWNKAVVRASWKLECVTATQIAGVKFVQNNCIVTVSKCQKVMLWKWFYDVENSSLHASAVSCCTSSISDIEDVDVINTGDGEFIVVCGCGVEVISIDVASGEVKKSVLG